MKKEDFIQVIYLACKEDPSFVLPIIDAATEGVKDFAKNQNDKVSHSRALLVVCDMKIDRDFNASQNLKQIYRESSSRINASGDGSSLEGESPKVSPSLNEEFNKKSRVYILKI